MKSKPDDRPFAMRCNRCNHLRMPPDHPCSECACPEFRIEYLDVRAVEGPEPAAVAAARPQTFAFMEGSS